jgi:hypothetical protein
LFLQFALFFVRLRACLQLLGIDPASTDTWNMAVRLNILLFCFVIYLMLFLQAARMLVQLLGYDPASITRPGQPGYGAGSGAPAVMLAYVKHLWATGDRKEALSRCESCWWE